MARPKQIDTWADLVLAELIRIPERGGMTREALVRHTGLNSAQVYGAIQYLRHELAEYPVLNTGAGQGYLYFISREVEDAEAYAMVRASAIHGQAQRLVDLVDGSLAPLMTAYEMGQLRLTLSHAAGILGTVVETDSHEAIKETAFTPRYAVE